MIAHVTRRNFIRGIGLISTSAALAACAQQTVHTDQASEEMQAATPLLAIIHTNDTHGHDVEVKGDDSTEGNFSMAAVAALKKEWEQKGYEVLLVDAGDATQGTPLVDTSDGAPSIAFMNSCGYNLMAVGNHEFDWGLEALDKNVSAAAFPVISANVLDAKTGELHFAPNTVVELEGGTKVGFFGLTTPTTRTTTHPKNIEGLQFLEEDELIDCALEQVDELRGQGCDLVVCVGHLGNQASSGQNTSANVLQNVEGIDLFIDGHDHLQVEEEVAGTLLVETGCYLHNIGVVAIDEGVPTNQPVPYGSFDGIDTATQAIIDDENARVEEQLGVVLGSTPFMLDGERVPGVRTQETNLGDFCSEAFRWTASQELGSDVDAGLLNGGGIRASVGAGDISLKVIKTVMPFSNELAVIDVTGAQLLEALEAACQGIGANDAMGAFPQVSRITYTIDASIPYDKGPNYPDSAFASPAAPGARVTIEDVNGKGFSEDATYSIATSNYLCIGGDTYHAFKDASDVKEPTTFGFDYEAFVSFLVEGCDHTVPNDYAEPHGYITITGLE